MDVNNYNPFTLLTLLMTMRSSPYSQLTSEQNDQCNQESLDENLVQREGFKSSHSYCQSSSSCETTENNSPLICRSYEFLASNQDEEKKTDVFPVEN